MCSCGAGHVAGCGAKMPGLSDEATLVCPDRAVRVVGPLRFLGRIGTIGLAGTRTSREKPSTDRVDVEVQVGIGFKNRFEGNLESGRKRPRGHFGTRLVDQP